MQCLGFGCNSHLHIIIRGSLYLGGHNIQGCMYNHTLSKSNMRGLTFLASRTAYFAAGQQQPRIKLPGHPTTNTTYL